MDINKLKQDPEKIKQLIDLLGSLLNEEDEVAEVPKKKRVAKKTTRRKKTTNKQPESKNKFLDMPEMHMHKEDNKIDQQLQKLPQHQEPDRPLAVYLLDVEFAAKKKA